MNTTFTRIAVTMFRFGLVGFIVVGCTKESDSLDPEFGKFVKSKQAQAKTVVESQGLGMPGEGWKIFEAVLTDDYSRATNLFARLEYLRTNTPSSSPFQNAIDWFEKLGLYSPKVSALQTAAWQPIVETYWAYILKETCHKPFLEIFVQDAFSAIPSNCIYLGASDSGRFAITSSVHSHSQGRPFFVLTQNQFVDGGYREHVELMYGKNLQLPNSTDAQIIFQDHLVAEQLRSQNSQSVGGPSGLMRLNALFVKHVFERNPDREFYIEQGIPMRWTYPHLLPYGPILKLAREPLNRIPESAVATDRTYWSNLCARLIGDWIKDSTTPDNVCDFVESVYLKKVLREFRGDLRYVAARREQEMFAKLRYSVADVYWWRLAESKELEEKVRMNRECGIAFMQAFGLGPSNAEVALYLGYYLSGMRRYDEAIRVMEIGLGFNPDDEELKSKLEEIKTTERTADGNLN